MKNIKGIIFDMDNTLLRSRIDFESMKHETYKFLSVNGVLPSKLDLSNHTTSTIIDEAIRTDFMSEKMIEEMWEIVTSFELAGMQDADLEPGVIELLDDLKGNYIITVVTNNSLEAAETALQRNAIRDYFEYIVGRGNIEVLKPSPDGILHVLQRLNHIQAEEWVSIGDSWIDANASITAGVDFILYQGDIAKLYERGLYPIAQIHDIKELKNLLS